MDRKELAYAITLAASLFSLSLLLFSQGTTSLSVSLSDEQPFAVDIPTMFSMNKVLIMIVLASFGSHSLTMLTSRLGSTQNVRSSVITECATESINRSYSEDDTNLYDNDTTSVKTELAEQLYTDNVRLRSLPFDKTEHKKKIAVDILQGEEKMIYMIVCDKKEILQNELVLESGLSKVKVSRLLQKLENKSLLTRKPYGNTNKVMLAE